MKRILILIVFCLICLKVQAQDKKSPVFIVDNSKKTVNVPFDTLIKWRDSIKFMKEQNRIKDSLIVSQSKLIASLETKDSIRNKYIDNMVGVEILMKSQTDILSKQAKEQYIAYQNCNSNLDKVTRKARNRGTIKGVVISIGVYLFTEFVKAKIK